VALLYALPTDASLEARWLLSGLNLLFSTLLPILTASLLAVSFLMTGSAAELVLGMGALTFGLAGLLAGLPLPGGHFGSGVAIHNIGTTATGALSLIAAILLRFSSGSRSGRSPLLPLLTAYGSVLVGMSLLYWLEATGTIPPFFVEGEGPTRLRQIVLVPAILALAVAGALMLVTARSDRSAAMRWYGLGLCLLAIGFWAVFGAQHAGAAIAWVGRGAQYLGDVYMLAAASLLTASAGSWSAPLKELQETARHSSDLLDSSPNAVLIEVAGTCVFANPAAARLFGVSAAKDLIGLRLVELMHPHDRLLIGERIADGSASGRSIPLQDASIVRKDGRRVDVEIVAVETRFHGEPAMQVILRDISVLRRSEEELRGAHALIEGITQGTDDMIAAEDVEFRYTYFNDAYRREFQRLWGREPEIGMSMIDAMAAWPEEQRKAREQWARALSGESFSVTMAFGPSERETQIYDVRFNPVLDADGRQIGAAHILRNVTEQTRTQQTLSESEARFRHLADSMPQLVWTANPDGAVDYYNERRREYAGIGPHKDDGRSWQKVLHDDDREPTVAAWERAVRTGTIYEAEHRVRMHDGSYRWHFSRGVPVRDDSGEIRKWYGFATDIQTLKTAEQARRRSEEHYQTALEGSGLVAARIDADLRYTWVHNPHPDFDPAGMIGRRDDELVPADEAAPIMALKREVLETGHSVHRVLAFERSDGTHWYEIRGVPLFDSADRVIGLTTAALDITDHKQAELALRESEERFRTLADNISQFAWMTDETGSIFWYNQRWVEYTGIPAEELLGWGWTRVHHPDHVQAVVEKVSACFESGEEWEDIFPLRGHDGEYRWFLSRAIPVRDAAGRIVRWFGTNTDITELRRIEHGLAQAKEEAEAANRAKSEFLAHMSHEIRTPIGGIIGMIDVLASRVRDPDQRGYIDLVKESAVSLLGIINDILDLSRIEAHQVSIEPVDWETRSAIESIIFPFRQAAANEGLDLSLEIAEGVPDTVRTDRDKVAQILRNLVSNAVKYTERGNVKVSVESDTLEARRARLRFRVIDTGVGIPADKHDAIFESFVRLRRSVTERNAEGTGLGLTITRRLADALGATIEVESAPGQGSTFTFAVHVEVLDRPRQTMQPSGSHGLQSLSPLRILLAEDNRINQLFMSMTLTEAGHEVTVAVNGKDALDMVARTKGEEYDLVLMDVQMPVMDGVEATRQIRALPGSGADLPVVALTAFAITGDEERFREAGMNGYVTKPVDTAELARVIRMSIDGRRA
jgi:PAS domain S-box-containing protein